jgi:hypothetical protein
VAPEAGEHLSDFRRILAEVAAHPSARYYILKSIIINNLFGVDVMPEAVEICKLRLFLKLVAQVEPDGAKSNLGLEALPDIDFNIRGELASRVHKPRPSASRSWKGRFWAGAIVHRQSH